MTEPPKEIYIIGAGGHGKVAVRAAQACGVRVVAVFDDNLEKIGRELCGVPVVGDVQSILRYESRPTLVAIGDNTRRLTLAEGLNLAWATIVHPAATVDASARLGDGVLVLAGAVIQVDASVGDHAIVNDNATVEHDCHLARGAHVSCNACLTGGARIGTGTLIGAGAIVLPEVSVGDSTIIGAGSVVTRNVPSGVKAFGVPARFRKRVSEHQPASRDRIYLSPPHMSSRERELLIDAFDSNWITGLGPHVDAFEQEMCAKLAARHAVALSSGTAALHLALLVAGVQPGDVVLTSTLTFAATANAIRYVGAEPVFIDGDRTSWNMDIQLLHDEIRDAASCGKLPKAVLVVDICGQCADWDPIMAICRRYGITVIEDAAEALGATYHDRPAGTLADIGCLSFNGNKIITTSGGGMLITENQQWAERARHLASQARDPALHYEHSSIGYNYRLSNLLAAIGRGQLELLEDRVARRRAIFGFYHRALSDVPGIEFMPEADFGRASRWLTCLLLDPRLLRVTPADVCQQLGLQNIEARPMWKPMHQQPVFTDCRVRGGEVADDIFRRGLCLPSGSSLSLQDLNRVADAFHSALTTSCSKAA